MNRQELTKLEGDRFKVWLKMDKCQTPPEMDKLKDAIKDIELEMKIASLSGNKYLVAKKIKQSIDESKMELELTKQHQSRVNNITSFKVYARKIASIETSIYDNKILLYKVMSEGYDKV